MDNGEMLGIIRDGKMHWEARFEHAPSQLRMGPAPPFTSVAMLLGGQTCRGVFNPGPPGRITWDDGEVWLRIVVI